MKPHVQEQPCPIGEAAQSAISPRAAGSQFAKKHMLAQALPAAHALSPRYFIMNSEGVWGETPCSRMALPDWRSGQPVIAERAAGNRFAKRRMRAPAEGIPE